MCLCACVWVCAHKCRRNTHEDSSLTSPSGCFSMGSELLVLAAKPDDLGSIPGTHMWEGASTCILSTTNPSSPQGPGYFKADRMFLPGLLAKIKFTAKSKYYIVLCLIFQYVPLKSKMYIYKSKHEAIIMLKEMSIKPFI